MADSLSESISQAVGPSGGSVAAAMSTATETVAAQANGSSSWLGLFGWLLIAVLNLVSTVLYWVLRIATLEMPSVLFKLFSTSWTVTMNATTLMLILAALGSAVSWVVRYRILNMYSRLPPEPQRTEPEIELFADTRETGTKSGLSNYLDEFLSAIQIFGYLERPVFHELTRSMQTRKLIAGETIDLEEEKGFCIVVDGLVEIFVKSHLDHRSRNATGSGNVSDEEDTPPGHQRYQLLTEVRNGAPMSSLFSIMSLFTEHVKLRYEEDHARQSAAPQQTSFNAAPTVFPSEIPVSMPNSPHLNDRSRHGLHREGSGNSATIAMTSQIPPISLDSPAAGMSHHTSQRPAMPERGTSSSAHPDIIARATVDTTIAIIPASAFRRLIRIYPKATSHIVHVILSRFQRVTLSQAFNYLGLTGEVLQTEKDVIKYTVCQLPNILRGEALNRLKEKFNRERERISDGEGEKGIALHNPAASRRRRSSTTLRKEAMLSSFSKTRHPVSASNTITSPRERLHPTTPGPGDLLTNVQLSRGTHRMSVADGKIEASISGSQDNLAPLSQRALHPFDKQNRVPIDHRDAVDEENLFRSSILESMFKALGLDGGGNVSREPESSEGSPRLVSLDRRARTLHSNSNAFGFMGPLDGSIDGESESVASSGFAPHATPTAHGLSLDMKDEIEIVFFPKGSVLVEQGERNPGLYYVVDGFLEIGTTTKGNTSDLFPPSHPKPGASGDFTPEPSLAEPFPALEQSETIREKKTFPEKTAKHRRRIALVKPGGLAGYIGSVSSYRSFIDVTAKTDVYVGFLPRVSLERIVDRHPIILLTMAKRLTHILPPLVLHIDFALEWVQVNAQQTIYQSGDESDAIYIVLNGRLRLVEDKKDGGMTARAEFGQGESVGELEALTETPRSGTLHAIRDTELVKLPRTLFNGLAQEHPNIAMKISKIIATRMRATMNDATYDLGKEAGGSIANKRKSNMNLRTVTILPVSAGVPVVEFGHRLMTALAQVGPPTGATSLNQAGILNHLGKHAFSKIGKLRLSQYLADLEEKYGLVVYVAGKSFHLQPK